MTTLAEWADDLLRSGGWPLGCAPGIVAQAIQEGSQATDNPLDTTMPAPGTSDFNSVGVRDYTSVAQGIAATIATIRNGLYPDVVDALARGDDLSYVIAVANSPWGTWRGNPSAATAMLRQVVADWAHYAALQVAGSLPSSPASPAPSASAPAPQGASPRKDMDDMAFLAQQPGEPGVWVVAGDLATKHPLVDPASELALLALGYAKTSTLSAAELASIPTVPTP
jgi:hypothetical protein